MDGFTEQFVRDQNILHYRRLLARVTDESQRQLLLNLLADEEAKQHLPKEKVSAPGVDDADDAEA